jgi:hypothetical protein
MDEEHEGNDGELRRGQDEVRDVAADRGEVRDIGP